MEFTFALELGLRRRITVEAPNRVVGLEKAEAEKMAWVRRVSEDADSEFFDLVIRTVASTPAKVAKKPPAEKRPQPVKAVEEQEATQILNIENAKGLSKYSQDRLVPAGRVKKGSKVYVEMGGEFLPATVEPGSSTS